MPWGLRIASRCQKPQAPATPVGREPRGPLCACRTQRQGRGPLSLALVVRSKPWPIGPFWLRLRRSPRISARRGRRCRRAPKLEKSALWLRLCLAASPLRPSSIRQRRSAQEGRSGEGRSARWRCKGVKASLKNSQYYDFNR